MTSSASECRNGLPYADASSYFMLPQINRCDKDTGSDLVRKFTWIDPSYLIASSDFISDRSFIGKSPISTPPIHAISLLLQPDSSSPSLQPYFSWIVTEPAGSQACFAILYCWQASWWLVAYESSHRLFHMHDALVVLNARYFI